MTRTLQLAAGEEVPAGLTVYKKQMIEALLQMKGVGRAALVERGDRGSVRPARDEAFLILPTGGRFGRPAELYVGVDVPRTRLVWPLSRVEVFRGGDGEDVGAWAKCRCAGCPDGCGYTPYAPDGLCVHCDSCRGITCEAPGVLE